MCSWLHWARSWEILRSITCETSYLLHCVVKWTQSSQLASLNEIMGGIEISYFSVKLYLLAPLCRDVDGEQPVRYWCYNVYY